MLALDPTHAPALFNLAILRTASGNSQEAITLYQRVVAVDSRAASAWLNLGLLQRVTGQRIVGNSSVQRAITLNPKLKDPAKTPIRPTTPSGPATK